MRRLPARAPRVRPLGLERSGLGNGYGRACRASWVPFPNDGA